MAQDLRPRFKTTQDWHNFIGQGPELTGAHLLEIRSACYADIEKLRQRPLLVYAAKMDNIPQGAPNFIDLQDIDGFTDLVNVISSKDGIDVLIHSPGGRPDATERIVSILRNKFSEITFLVPHSAYSAATMLALSGNDIILHPSATLGPIDPQINGIPARSIKRGFENAKKVIKKEGPESLPAYVPLIEKYSLDLLEVCDDSEKLSKKLVSVWLKEYMFNGRSSVKIKRAVDFFSKYDIHLLHSRPLFFKKLEPLGLKISVAEGELCELLWEAYVLLNGFFSVSPFIKLFECRHGISWGTQSQVIPTPAPPAK